MTRSILAPRKDRRQAKLDYTPYILILPVVLMLAGTLLWPWSVGFYTSLTNLRIGRWGAEHFVGLANYIGVLTSPAFWSSFRITVTFAVMCVVVEMTLGLALALLLTRKLPGMRFFRSIFIIPFMVPTVVCGLIWRQLLDVQGAVNYGLSFFSIPALPWLSSSSTVLPSLLLIDVWQTTPQVIILMFAALQTVPRDLYEAAKVDGAGAWTIFWRITLPSILPYFLVSLLIRSIELLQVLDIVLVASQGGPANASLVLHLSAYRETFVGGFLGYGTSIAYILGFLVVFVALSIARWLRRIENSAIGG